MSDRRPKRRCVAAKAQQVVPSAIHYVGYVEDDETPEMIMKKFEELERIQKAAEARRQQQQQINELQTQVGPDSRLSDLSAGAATTVVDGNINAATGQSCRVAHCPVSGPLESHPTLPPTAEQPGSTAGGSGSEPCTGPAGGDADQMLLDEEALLEVFRQTSIFNVRSALLNKESGEPLLGSAAVAGVAARYDIPYGVAYGMEDMLFVGGDPSDMEDEELQQEFWSDEDYELGGGRSSGGRRRRHGGNSSRANGQRSGSLDDSGPREFKQPRSGVPSGPSRQAMNQVVMQYNRDTNALIRRRLASGSSGAGCPNGAAGGAGGGGLVQLRLPPPPLPLSWGRNVRPYHLPEPSPQPEPFSKAAPCFEIGAAAGPSLAPCGDDVFAYGRYDGTAAEPPITDPATSSRGFESTDLTAFPFESALGAKHYIAVMVNAGWQIPNAADAFERGCEAEVMHRFCCLPIPRLCPRGFVLVWAHKGLLQAVCRALAGWGYVYVENLTWVHLTPANAIATSQRGRHFRRSHSTLLIFRREGEGRDIELRHQRNPDVVFDCIRTLPDGSGWDMPSEVLTTIETMLPGGKGAFLELWAPKGQRRPGWDHVTEVR